MMEWWVFPALVLCAVTFTAAAGVLVFLAARGVWRLLAAWRRSPRHAWRDPQEATPEEIRAAGEAVGRGYRTAWVPWDTDPRFGSMQLDADRAYQERVTWAMDAYQPPTVPPDPRRVINWWPDRWWQEPQLRPDWREVAHEGDWRAQTRRDLAPAVLDSGPGGPSLAPGPDPAPALAPMYTGDDGEGEGRAFHGLNHADTEPGRTVAGRLVETSDEWLRRLVADARKVLVPADELPGDWPGWTWAGTVAA